MSETAQDVVWCVVANVVPTRPYGQGGEDVRRGTKHFSPGTKVYIRHPFWGMGGESVEVVARHRGSKRFVVMTIRTSWLENFRAELAYSPKVLSLLTAKPGEGDTHVRGDGHSPWDDTPASQTRAEEWATRLDAVARAERSRWPLTDNGAQDSI